MHFWFAQVQKWPADHLILISNLHLSSDREVLEERQEGCDVAMGDMRGQAVTSVVILGSTAVG